MRRLLLVLVLLFAAPAAALDSLPVETPRATAVLTADHEAVAPGQTLRLLLRFRLADGWHIYWRNPGDAGGPPEIAWTLPEGASAGPLLFPAPHRIPYPPLLNYGYTGAVAFPVSVTVPRGLSQGEVFTLEAEARWLICADICIPEEGAFRLDLPVEAAPRPAANAGLFAAAEASLPRPSPFAVRLGFEGRAGAIEVTGPGLSPATLRGAEFFPLDPGLLSHPAPQPLAVREGGFTLRLLRGEGPVPALVEGVVAITDAAGVRSAYAVSAVPGPVPGGAGLALWQAALLALAGGLLLNLMPCVFPVLAMKAMAVARMGGAARGAVRAEALAYTAGVVVSFLALAVLLIGLRAAGSAAGWGFQFTEPGFVAAMAWLMLAVGLNLSGVFAVPGVVLGGARSGAFGTGVLAVLVATPCTAPFMAAAIGAALAMDAAATLAVFAALGLGMALPFAALALAPGLARVLPRPGPWMERLRQGLAFPMYGAAVWLAWVVSVQAGPQGVLVVLAGAVLVGFGAWLVGVAQAGAGAGGPAPARPPHGRRIALAASGAAVLAALALLPFTGPGPGAAPAAQAEEGAERWSPERVAAALAEGRPVFVNLTAAWCITCQVNDRVALRTPAVRAAMAATNTLYLVGDWTRGDAAIGALIRSVQREGVPVYLLYRPGAAAPEILPQILTEGIVLRALQAGRAAPVARGGAAG
ncbi:MAG: protein-disulfide reductase DsbD family protein [Acetobacteraceae bacterium]|nr:protein-disulfide reductase DsbD family protein [Acetobacteraceae bacterium]